jgi:hypothetical protein
MDLGIFFLIAGGLSGLGVGILGCCVNYRIYRNIKNENELNRDEKTQSLLRS